MPPVIAIKKEAKESLRGKWTMGFAIASVIIGMFFIGLSVWSLFSSLLRPFLNDLSAFLISLIPVLLLWQFLGVPLLYGTLRWCWYISGGENVPFVEIFYYLGSGKNYFRAISLGFRIFLRIIIILALCFSPSIIITIICMPKFYSLFGFSMPYFVSSLWALGNVLEFFGATLSVILLIRYVPSPILLINDEKISPQEALNLSIIISKFANGKTISFLFSFFLWALLSVLVIPLFYVIPFFLVSYCFYCRHLIDNYNKIVAFENSKIYPNYEPYTFR